MSKQTQFFGTKNDLLDGLARVDEQLALKYVLFDKPQETDILKSYDSLKDFETLGLNHSGKTGGAGRFFVLDREVECVLSAVPQNSGGIRFFVEPTNNPTSIVFQPSGFYQAEGVDRCLLPGSFGTALDHPDSQLLYKEFRKMFLKAFMLHKRRVYVGSEAMILLEEGETRFPSYSAFAGSEHDFVI